MAFQYDYNCDQLGMLAFMLNFTDASTAAKCVLAMGNPDIEPQARRDALELAAKHPLLVASWNERSEEPPARMELEWCEELQLVALQAVQRRQLGWLMEFRSTFGPAAATVALRSWHDFGLKFDA